MLKDITMGRYYHADSVLHGRDPRVKLFGALIFIITVFMCDNPVIIAMVTFFLICVAIMSKVPILYMLKGIRTVFFLLLISVIFTLLFSEGNIVWQIWKIKITDEGIRRSAIIIIRLSYIVTGSAILTLTTTPNDLADGLETALSPLKVIKIPVHDMAMIMSIAFRFIPILMDEAEKIMRAQMARGADFYDGGLLKRAKGIIPLIVPLIVSAVNRAMELASAMEARCYTGNGQRSRMKPLKYNAGDYAGYIICILYLAAVITVKILV